MRALTETAWLAAIALHNQVSEAWKVRDQELCLGNFVTSTGDLTESLSPMTRSRIAEHVGKMVLCERAMIREGRMRIRKASAHAPGATSAKHPVLYNDLFLTFN